MPVCPHCGSYKHKNTWTSDLFGEVIRRVIKNTFHISNELKRIDVNTECKEKKEGMECKVIISGFLDDVEITEEHSILVCMKKTVCDVCSKQVGGYFEATLQIRADKRRPTKEELGTIRLNVENLVENLRTKGNRGLFITDIAEGHGGIDFYLSEKGSAYTIAKKIQEKFGGEIKQSSKNIGMKDSRQIFRMTCLIRLPAYRKDDFISLDNSYFYIYSISGNKVHTFELSNWAERVFDGRALHKASIYGGKELIKEMIFVSQSKDEMQLMDPNTYKTFEIKKPKKVTFKSNAVKIVKIEDKLFLFPEKNITDK